MDRTPIGRKFIRELIKVNDQLCYSALVHHELESTVLNFAQSSPDAFTPALFPENPFSERIFRKAEHLPAFSLESRSTGFRMAMIVGFELVLAYLEEIQAYRAELIPSQEDSLRQDSIEDQIFEKLRGWLSLSPPAGYFRTLGYFRHMRNSFAHGYDTPSPKFLSFAAKYGHSLNAFWDNGTTQLSGLDFKTLSSATMSSDLAFACMNLLCICLRVIDARFASTLSLEAVLKGTVTEILARRPDLKQYPFRVVSKSRAIIRSDYGERFSKDVVSPLVESLLVDIR